MSFAERILAHLQTITEETVDLLDAMLSSYPTSYRKLRRGLLRSAPKFKADWALWYRERQHFYTTLNRLRKSGLIEATKRSKTHRSLWRITRKGKEKLGVLKKRKKNPLITPHGSTESSAASLVLVIFDIPEQERRKRYWLRETLKTLKFQMLQRSVWIGKNKLPIELLHNLRKYRILRHVHVLTVNKRGTVGQLSE